MDTTQKTVNNVLSVLNTLLKKAAEWRVMDGLACAIQLLPTAKKPAAFHDFEDYERLVAAAKMSRADRYPAAMRSIA